MAETGNFEKFRSQRSIKQNEYASDNLFAGVWHLDTHHLDSIDPYISGYAFIVWTKTPAFFDLEPEAIRRLKITENNFKSLSGIGDFTVSTEDMTHGFAGNAIGVATSIQKENTSFSITMQELKGSPVREIFDYWVSGIHDPETGLATYHGRIADQNPATHLDFSMANHTGELLYIVTDPSGGIGGGSGIEAAFYFTNVFPTKIPMDHLNYTSGDHSLAEISMDFRGTLHKSQQINELAAAFLKKHAIAQSYNVHGYGDYGHHSTLINDPDGIGYHEGGSAKSNGDGIGNNRYGTAYNDFDEIGVESLHSQCNGNMDNHR